MIFLLLIVLLLLFGIVVLMQPKYGKKPSGKGLNLLLSSTNYNSKDKAFSNRSKTPALAEGTNYGSILKDFLFKRSSRRKPQHPIPATATDLHKIKKGEDIFIWFGHSSYFLQLNNKTVLVDPVFSGNASPFSFLIKAFKGSNSFKAKDIPVIDYLFLTHDHWDHLDYNTITALRPKIKRVICGLGMSNHLIYWGFNERVIDEMDWDKHLQLDEHYDVYTIPARHFSGRGLKRNATLWTSFILRTPDFKIFIGGDSGYDSHFKKAGELFGPFDLAILENGQYDLKWKYIHMQPEEVLSAAQDLKTKSLIPVHNSKFALANHAWDEPLERISEHYANNEYTFKLLTPQIGEPLNLKNPNVHLKKWWKHLESK